MTRPLEYFVIDAFTARPFAGNPAAVVPLESWLDDRLLQNIALEMNLSETAYLAPNGDGYHLRWFTPKVEVDLCGHATLASAMALVQLGKLADGGVVRFSTRSGMLTAARRGEAIQLDFPLVPQAAVEPPAELVAALGASVKYMGRSRHDYLVEVASEAEVRSLSPDFKRLASCVARDVIVTARSDSPDFDFVSRFFAPAAGIDEDPVTGSAHCCLAHFWSERLGKQTFRAYQASARGGVLQVEICGERVVLGGQAVVVARGELLLGQDLRA